MIGSKADYRRDDFIMSRQSKTPWIPLEKTEPLKPIWPYFAIGAVGAFCLALLVLV